MALSAGELLLEETVLLSKNANYRLGHGGRPSAGGSISRAYGWSSKRIP